MEVVVRVLGPDDLPVFDAVAPDVFDHPDPWVDSIRNGDRLGNGEAIVLWTSSIKNGCPLLPTSQGW